MPKRQQEVVRSIDNANLAFIFDGYVDQITPLLHGLRGIIQDRGYHLYVTTNKDGSFDIGILK